MAPPGSSAPLGVGSTSKQRGSGSSIFPPPIVAELVRRARPVTLQRGAVLFTSGHPFESCYLVLKGVVKLSAWASRGRERILSLQGQGALVGALGLLDGQPYSTTAVALTDGHFLAIPGAAFDDVRGRHPEIETELVRILAGKIREASENASWGGLLDARRRVAHAVIRFAELMGRASGETLTEIDGVTHADISALAYVAREEVTRTLADWKRSGIVVAADHRQGLVVDLRRLAQEAAD